MENTDDNLPLRRFRIAKEPPVMAGGKPIDWKAGWALTFLLIFLVVFVMGVMIGNLWLPLLCFVLEAALWGLLIWPDLFYNWRRTPLAWFYRWFSHSWRTWTGKN